MARIPTIGCRVVDSQIYAAREDRAYAVLSNLVTNAVVIVKQSVQ